MRIGACHKARGTMNRKELSEKAKQSDNGGRSGRVALQRVNTAIANLSVKARSIRASRRVLENLGRLSYELGFETWGRIGGHPSSTHPRKANLKPQGMVHYQQVSIDKFNKAAHVPIHTGCLLISSLTTCITASESQGITDNCPPSSCSCTHSIFPSCYISSKPTSDLQSPPIPQICIQVYKPLDHLCQLWSPLLVPRGFVCHCVPCQ